jgi:hypothetical protein
VLFRWIVALNRFEAELYGFPMWDLRLEVEDVVGAALASWSSAAFRDHIGSMAQRILDAPPWGDGYVSSKVVASEPLCDVLLHAGFEVVERRRIFRCRVRDLATRQEAQTPEGVQFTSLATIPDEQSATCREQILSICREAFEGKGHSRHFTDPVLLAKMPGIEYIMAVMKLNFEHVLLEHFLVAVHAASGEVCGFSAIGRKPGLVEATYTRLLTAVKREYRRQGVYLGLAALVARTLPQDTTLVDVIQTENLAIQRAYQRSGRVALADTVVLRRVLPPTVGSGKRGSGSWNPLRK